MFLRVNGSPEWLSASGWAVGVFDSWKGDVGRTLLHPGDTLVLYTDGATEALNPAGEELGAAGLLDRIRARVTLVRTH